MSKQKQPFKSFVNKPSDDAPAAGQGLAPSDMAERVKQAASKKAPRIAQTAPEAPSEARGTWFDGDMPPAAPLSTETTSESPTDPKVQFSVTGAKSVADRFKALAKTERRSYLELIEVLMDEFEAQRGRG